MKTFHLTWAVMIMVALLATGSGAWAAFEDVYDMPLAEADDIVSGWLGKNGFKIYRASSSPDAATLIADKGSQQLRITAHRSSPLAARIRIEVVHGPAHASANRLHQHLRGYIQLPNQATLKPEPSYPNVVRGYVDAVVCIYAVSNGREIQLTGFAIDIPGMIISTAHDLYLGQVVDLMRFDGRETAGTVVKIDRFRDLALIQATHPLESVIWVRNGRYNLNEGDAVFAVTCANGGFPTIRGGLVDGLPQRVNDMVLDQVQMHIDPGSSGSPVFDDRGRLAAVIKGRHRGTEVVGFMIQFETLMHFLERY